MRHNLKLLVTGCSIIVFLMCWGSFHINFGDLESLQTGNVIITWPCTGGSHSRRRGDPELVILKYIVSA